jgi:hypothetical protein
MCSLSRSTFELRIQEHSSLVARRTSKGLYARIAGSEVPLEISH